MSSSGRCAVAFTPLLLLLFLGPPVGLAPAAEVRESIPTAPTLRAPLEIVALTIRTHGLPEGEVEVAVTARDDEPIGRIDVDCGNGQRHAVAGRGRPFLSGLVRCRPGDEITAVAFSRDGTRAGQPFVERHIPHDHGIEEVERLPPGVLRRLADERYPERVGAFDDYAIKLVPLSVDGRPWWHKWAESAARKPFDFAANCGAHVKKVGPDGAALRCWLELHPKVRESIVWHEYDAPGPLFPAGAKVRKLSQKWIPYDEWTEDMKTWLDVSVYWAYAYLDGGLDWFPGQYLPDVPDNLLSLDDHNWAMTAISRDDAWNLYLGTIAHSLAVELGRFVPWSIAEYRVEDLQILFHSDLLINAFKTHLFGTGDIYGYQARRVVPAPPARVFEFLVDRDLVRPTAYSTVGKFIEWGKHGKNLFHDRLIPDLCFPGTNLCGETYYGYRGFAPVMRLLEGTSYTDVKPPYITWGPAGWVPGCHGMAALFQQSLRVLNIPVDGEASTWIKGGYMHKSALGDTGHSTPFFWTIGQTLSHGDDVYGGNNDSTPPFPGHWLLLPLETYQDWFYGKGQIGPKGNGNVGRQAYIEVPLKALSNALLQRYCIDEAAGVSHQDGSVAAFFRHEDYGVAYYEVSELEAMNLWEKLAAKAAALGYCN